jgi:predicted metalloprotease
MAGSASAAEPPPVPNPVPVEPAPGGLAPPASDPAAGDLGYTVTSYIDYVIQDVDAMWSQWFQTVGFQAPYVEYVVIQEGQTFVTDCTPLDGNPVLGPATQNMYYCPLDGDGAVQQPDRGLDANGNVVQPTDPAVLSDGENEGGIVFPVLSMQKLWTGDILSRTSPVVGDFAAAIVVAHEFGHHITHEWLINDKVQNPASTAGFPTGKWNELVADCFAGVWANSAYYKGILEPGDIEEGVAAMSVLGDQAGVANPDPHGSAAERTTAVWDGYNTGDPVFCATKYWQYS